MRIAISIVFYVAFGFLVQKANAQTNIANFEELLKVATSKSLTLKSGNIQFSQAKQAKLAALLGIIDPIGNTTISYTNNTQLPVNLFPAEILGGQAGTFKEVKLGVQYQTNVNTYIDIKLLNLQGWEGLKLSKINVQLVESENKITLKNLHENLAVIYYNVVTLQEQLKATEQNLMVADTLYKSTVLKYQQGFGKQQDINDSKVNVLTIEESIRQMQFHIQQQLVALKLLADIPETEDLRITQTIPTEEIKTNISVENNNLLLNNASLREQFAHSNYKKNLYGNAPTFSFFGSMTTQQFNTQATLFDSQVNWIPSSYIGIKFSIPLPNANTISQVVKTKYDYLLAKNHTEQIKVKANLQQKQLQIDFDKSLSQYKSHKEIVGLRRDTYQKNFINYQAGIINLEQTMHSFNAMVNSNYNFIASTINILLAESKVIINNKMK